MRMINGLAGLDGTGELLLITKTGGEIKRIRSR